MISQKRLRQILKEYRTALKELLGDDLDSIVLYGSQARGNAVEGSDMALILKTEEISAPLSLKHDVVISTGFVTKADYEKRNTPFLMNVRREGVSV